MITICILNQGHHMLSIKSGTNILLITAARLAATRKIKIWASHWLSLLYFLVNYGNKHRSGATGPHSARTSRRASCLLHIVVCHQSRICH